MNGINKAILIGHASARPELNQTKRGVVTNFSVATNESWKDKATGQTETRVEWHRITAFNQLAQICNDLIDKGSKVYIEGSIRTNKYTCKTTGVEKENKDIIANVVQVLDYRERTDADNQQQYANSQPAHNQPPEFDGFDDKDVPF